MAGLLYHRFMVPDWLRKNADWHASYEGDETALIINADSADWETIFRVPLISAGVLGDSADITVNMKLGVVLPGRERLSTSVPTRNPDPISYMISDGRYSMGIQLLDPNRDYNKLGPFRAVEGTTAKNKLRNPDVTVGKTSQGGSDSYNPDQFDVTLKPSDSFGTAFCALNFGEKIVAQYSSTLELSKGLTLELYRDKQNEKYTINYIEVWVYQDNSGPVGFLQSPPAPPPSK